MTPPEREFAVRPGGDAIAIIGVGLRLPGGIAGLEELWLALREGWDVVGEVPPERFSSRQFVSGRRDAPGRTYTRAFAACDDIDSFDAEFFGIAPKEAARVDPQQRLMLECAVEALDDAGIDPAGLAGSDTAVFVGVSSRDYGDLQYQHLTSVNAYTNLGLAACNTANRISFALDLRGASAAVDTACSSALTALHQACEALRAGHSRLALAGGVNVLLSPAGFVGFAAAAMLSPTGRCRPFSARADGFVRAEGAGVFVLKPLTAALADGDRVHAVILATGAGADGRTAGLALPSVDAQTALLREVYGRAGLGPEAVAYIEAHGTGTQAGDPVECRALGEWLAGRATGPRGAEPVPVGSVKGNLGHLESAAAVPGVLKAMLVLREGVIPATPHSEPLNDTIDFPSLGLAPVTAARPLPAVAGERAVVGVNSFGFGGANAHAVLAAAPPSPARPATRPGPRVLPVVVSARTERAVAQAALTWADHLETMPPERFYDAAYTACRRRGHHERRYAALAPDARTAAAALRALAEREPVTGAATGMVVTRHGRVAFLFSGNGTQWAGMGVELLDADTAFRAEVTALDAALSPLLGWSVLHALRDPADAVRQRATDVAQPLLFAVQAGLVAALAARGIRPAAVAGHSVGEVAAAHCAGALDRDAACLVIAERSRAQAPTAGRGRMAAVGLGHDDAQAALEAPRYAGRLVVASVNSSRAVTVAGEAGALAALGEELAARGVFFRDLGLDHAFHSPDMDGLREPLEAALTSLAPARTRLPMISTVTGARVEGTELTGAYWWRNVREPVRFADAVGALLADESCDVLVEIGPHPALGVPLRHAAHDWPDPAAVIPTLSRTAAGPEALDTVHARLLSVGARLDWDPVFPERGEVVSLPAYPWQRERHWNGDPRWWETRYGTDPASADPPHPLPGVRLPGPDARWQTELDPAGELAWLGEHRVGDAVVVPAVTYADAALAAGRQVLGAPAELIRLRVDRALVLPWHEPGATTTLHTALTPEGALTVSSRAGEDGPWREHAHGQVRALLAPQPPALDVTAIRSGLTDGMDGDECHATMRHIGDLRYGPLFKALTALRFNREEVLAEYTAPPGLGPGHVLHPALLDGCLQASVPLMAAALEGRVTHLPSGVDRVRRWRPLPETGLAHVRLRSVGSQGLRLDVTVTTPDGEVAAEVLGLHMRRYAPVREARPPGRLTEVLRAAPLPGSPAPGPAPLPAPSRVLAGCAAEVRALTGRGRARRPAPDPSALGRLGAHFTAAAVGRIVPGRETFSLADLLAAGVDAKHTPLLRALLPAAERHGLLTGAGADRWRTAAAPEPERLFRELVARAPDAAVEQYVFGVCGRILPDVLLGRTDPAHLLFSGPDHLARHHDAAASVRLHHDLARCLLRTALAAWPAGRPLRVLEIGAGTGGLTAAALADLPVTRTHYTCTDPSAAARAALEERFGDRDHVDVRALDLTRDPAEQGFTPGAHDLVLASRALHAAPDLERALRAVAGLLTDGGHLLAVEPGDDAFFPHVFGLLDTFWNVTDPHLRPHGPLVPREAWPGLLSRCGFGETVQLGAHDAAADGQMSTLLAARTARPSRPGSVGGVGGGDGTRDG
ncbi:beta-ketoacyl synthase N-terminal-like domain-containing protein, partial [Streptomyces sp. URMC 129]|uniref:beta-ketoacyl synthase N-terminal-like domain-containing protein n=1 Tax=Streptomyces sp. URMC 129 TaxID=3423407 RepID=UPI003F1C2A3E